MLCCRLMPITICPFVFKACNGSVVYASNAQRCPSNCTTPPIRGNELSASIARPAWLLVTALLSLLALLGLLS